MTSRETIADTLSQFGRGNGEILLVLEPGPDDEGGKGPDARGLKLAPDGRVSVFILGISMQGR